MNNQLGDVNSASRNLILLLLTGAGIYWLAKREVRKYRPRLRAYRRKYHARRAAELE